MANAASITRSLKMSRLQVKVRRSIDSGKQLKALRMKLKGFELNIVHIVPPIYKNYTGFSFQCQTIFAIPPTQFYSGGPRTNFCRQVIFAANVQNFPKLSRGSPGFPNYAQLYRPRRDLSTDLFSRIVQKVLDNRIGTAL